MIQKYYGPWNVPAYEATIATEPEQTAAKSAAITWDNPTLPQVAVAFKIPAFSAKTRDSAALDILSELVFGETSPLYQDLVIREQKVEELYAYAPFRRDPGLIIVFTKINDVASVDDVRERIFQAVEYAAKNPVDVARLDATKSNIRYSFAMSLDTARSVAGHETRFIGLTGDASSINDLYRRYDEITAADVMRVAATYLTRARSTEVTLTGGAQ
jgi:zinc protease